ncbi:hypothetical protein HJ052_12010 [Vibrio parahaemolyticus]|uniref:hypothetical protein n=1 Tax=Vibrio parahaemolyticus TaxID=670 RepID=UPI001E11A2C4|nr:hypothetical protein [Vibrio parahaemolyticus]HCG5948052.1 hypothetical protein [Vibrio parahaemolyticus]HCG8318000.1 hypothetical protein [Vibrio parahaemolyticus]
MSDSTTENVVDFGLFTYGREYYESAQVLKENHLTSNSYYILLALAIECFLKSIRTTVMWNGSVANKVQHTKNVHDLAKIYHKITVNYPEDAACLEQKYAEQFQRSLKADIELNKDVFTLRRYPYSNKGEIPKIPLPQTREELLYGMQYKNDIAVYVTHLEDVAQFFNDSLSCHFY